MRRSQSVREPLASRFLFPLTERSFTYKRYDAWLERLGDRRVVPLVELAAAERPALGLRHDVDTRLGSALELARLEAARGIRATYFVLHSAPYYSHDARFADVLRRLQDEHGHEVGWHSDLVPAALLRGVDPGAYLRRELDWLRAQGLEIRGVAAHGSPEARNLGVHNNYVFAGWDEPQPGFPRTDVEWKLDPAEFGLEYEAYHLGADLQRSDSSFDARGHRWHPDELDLGLLDSAGRSVVLVHPCHWDASPAAKAQRLARKVAARLRAQRPHAAASTGA